MTCYICVQLITLIYILICICFVSNKVLLKVITGNIIMIIVNSNMTVNMLPPIMNIILYCKVLIKWDIYV